MRIVVAGGGVVGFRIAQQLMTSHDVVLIGATERDQARLDRLDIESLPGPITSPSVLTLAAVPDADVFVATSQEDEKNIVACVAARRLGAKQVICFLNRRGFFSVSDDEAELAESLGIDAVIRPAAQLAEDIVQIVTVPGALDARSFFSGRVQLQKFMVEEDSVLSGTAIQDIKLPSGAILVTGQRGEEFFLPRGDSVFEPGDRVTVLGTPKGLRRLQRFLLGSRTRRKRGKALIVGGGLVGGAVAEGLTQAGWVVKVIESDRTRCTEIAGQLDCLVIHGDGSDLELLEQEASDEPDALVAVTSNDEKNLLISLLAQHLGVPRVITRADRLVNERIFEKVGVDVVLSAKGTAIRRVVSDLIESDSRHVDELEHGDFQVLDLELPTEFKPIRLQDLQLPRFAIIGAIFRGRSAKIPGGKHVLEPRDRLLVICHHAREAELFAALGLPAPDDA